MLAIVQALLVSVARTRSVLNLLPRRQDFGQFDALLKGFSCPSEEVMTLRLYL